MLVFSFALIVGVVGLVALAALALFILGVIYRKPALWITGICLGLLPITAVVAGFFLFAISAPSTTTAPPPVIAARAVSAAASGPFERNVGAELPVGTEILEMGTSESDGVLYCHMRVSATDWFDELLRERFEQVSWEDVEGHLNVPHAPEDWVSPEARQGTCYLLARPGDADSPTSGIVAVAYSKKYCVASIAIIERSP